MHIKKAEKMKISEKKFLSNFFYTLKKNKFPLSFITAFLYRHVSLLEIRTIMIRKKRGYSNDLVSSDYVSEYPYRLGIIKEMRNNHVHFMSACRELKVSYDVIDISGPDWIENIDKSFHDGFLVYPSVAVSVWKQMYDERINIMVNELGKIVYPSYEEIWLFENKRRMNYWLKANKFPHPKTFIFYDEQSALDFAKSTPLPIVFKSTTSSGGRGIRIIRNRNALVRFVARFFKKGFLPDFHEKKDREWGSMLFQEYLPNVREWRVIRIGDSYFGYEKISDGGLHSGSGKWRYLRPPDELFDLAKSLTERGDFSSMDMDIFMTSDNRLLVNELQTFFGTNFKKEMLVIDDKAGRMIHNNKSMSWDFETGGFCNNNLCNLRVKELIKILDAGNYRIKHSRGDTPQSHAIPITTKNTSNNTLSGLN